MTEEVYQPEQEKEQELTLKELAEQIRDEKETGENTAERVGGLLVAMVEKGEETAEAVEALKGQQPGTPEDVEKLRESLSTLQGKQEATERNVSTLQDQQKATTQEVSDLRSKQQETAASVEALQTQQKTTAQEVSTLKEQQGTTASDVTKLKGDVSGLQGEQEQQGQSIATLKQQQQTTTQEIGTLKGQQQTTASDVTALQTQQKDTAGKVDTLQEKQTATDTAVKTLRTDVDTLKGQQPGTPGDVEKLVESLEQHKKDAEETYAKQDGTYEDLTAGKAMNLQGTIEMTNSSAYRTTGGNEDVLLGPAQVLSVQGNSVAWNQLYQPQNFTHTDSGGTKTIFENYNIKITHEGQAFGKNIYPIRGICNFIAKHKYLLKANVKETYASKLVLKNDTKWVYFNTIVECEVSGAVDMCLRESASDTDIDLTYSNIQLFDLTLIYGAGKEPTTPEQFEADYQMWFGKQLEYEEYDEGSIRTTLAEGIKTVGFNQYNGGDFKGSVKELIKVNNGILFNNDISYKGQFHISFDAYIDKTIPQNATFINVWYTDGSRSFIGFQNVNNNHVSVLTEKNKVVKYMSFSVGGYTDEILTLSNICINFSWSGIRDGEYEPYWSETQPLPLTTLKGKLNGEGESVVVFPDGMKRAGAVYDEIKIENGVTKAIKRVGSVDLGTLSWTYKKYSNVDKSVFEDAVSSLSLGMKLSTLNALCYKYNIGSLADIQNKDKVFQPYSQNNAEEGRIIIADDAYTDAETFKQSLQGVILYYELAEPQEYIIDDFELPLVYRIDDFGTEQILQPEKSIAPTITTKYNINAVDTIRRMRRNYISSTSMDTFLAKLSVAMGGTWSKSWDESRGGYDFAFVK